MRTCKECRWWGTERIFDKDDLVRECLNPELRASPACEPGDDFGKKSGVATNPDFGCIQFEPRAA